MQKSEYDANKKGRFFENWPFCLQRSLLDQLIYRYVHSLQGDIIAIVDSAGNTVVEYKGVSISGR